MGTVNLFSGIIFEQLGETRCATAVLVDAHDDGCVFVIVELSHA